MHPALFAALLYVSDSLMKGMSTYPQFRAMILVHMPKILQGAIAGLGDFYTWKLADKVYGRGSNYAWTAVCTISKLSHEILLTFTAHRFDIQSLAVVLLDKNTLEFS